MLSERLRDHTDAFSASSNCAVSCVSFVTVRLSDPYSLTSFKEAGLA
jgi:hypothetical protein